MGDMGEVFRELNEIKKQEKRKRYDKNMIIVKQCEFEYRLDLNGTVLFKTENGTVCFYPSTNKFMLKNRVYHGDAKSVLGFIRNRSKSNAVD